MLKKDVLFYDKTQNRLRDLFCEDGFEGCVCDINAAEFYTDIRYHIQVVEIPANKRGNLQKFAGKTVDVICTTVSRGAPRINFYIREHKNQ